VRKYRRDPNIWRLNNPLLNDQWVTGEIREEIKKYLESNENENTTEPLGHSKGSAKREVPSLKNKGDTK
jgi:hypothetical protein